MNHSSLNEIIETAIEIAEGSPVSERAVAVVDRCNKNPDEKELLESYIKTAGLLSELTHARDGKIPKPECLDDNDLADFVDNALDTRDLGRIEHHLAHCAYCRGELITLHRTLRIVQKSVPDIVEFVLRVARKGVELLRFPPVGFSSVQLSPAPVLGVPENENQEKLPAACAWKQVIEPFEVDFSAVHVDDDHVDLRLSILLHASPGQGTYLTLYKDGRLIQSEQVSADGRINLHNLQCGRYDAELSNSAGASTRFQIKLVSDID